MASGRRRATLALALKGVISVPTEMLARDEQRVLEEPPRGGDAYLWLKST